MQMKTDLLPTEIILQSLDIVFAEISASLHFDKY